MQYFPMDIEGKVGQLKPNRSDAGENLTEEEKEHYAQQVQEYLKVTTPVRALKPSRSENLDDSALLDSLPVPNDLSTGELERFKKLEAVGEVRTSYRSTYVDKTMLACVRGC